MHKTPHDLLGVEIPESFLVSRKLFIQLALFIVIGLTVWLWLPIVFPPNTQSTFYVLNIGQGDSELITLSSPNKRSSIKILIDGGKDRTVLTELNKVLGENDKYIDIVILTHTDLDHLGGIVEVLRRYNVGIFVSNGRETSSEAYAALREVLAERRIQSIALLEGDTVRYGNSTLSILSPDKTLLKHSEINESSIVAMLSSSGVHALLTSDIGFPAENVLLQKKLSLTADILKVGHHGSKYSSSENFIAAVDPTIAVIGVGKNSYGHPTPRALDTLALAGARIYRTDTDGTIEIPLDRSAKIEEKEVNQGFLASIASIMSGSYKQADFSEISLAQTEEERATSQLVPFKTCTFLSGGTPRHSPIVFNEIAWMGSESGATQEWIELRNLSGKNVAVAGWQIVNENERVHFTFPQKAMFEGRYLIIARSAAKEAVDGQFVFNGSLRNSNEGLRLYDNECALVDEVPVSTSWSAGNNKTKQTMERASDLTWRTSQTSGGTPGR